MPSVSRISRYVPKVVPAQASASKKWNPGHYVRADVAAFLSDSASVTAREDAYDLTSGNANLKGGLILVPWGSLETAEDVYDFTEIDRDLAYLSGLGKKLIIEPWYQKYGSSGATDTDYFPQYIIDGSGVTSIGSPTPFEFHVKIDETTWRDRYIAMMEALGARYDSDPDVEQIIITETASLEPVGISTYNTIVPAVAAAWPNTCVVLYLNWGGSAAAVASLVALCDSYGVGIGGPDILPTKAISPSGPGEDHGSRATRGDGVSSLYNDGTNFEDFGSTEHRGRIPISYSYEAGFSLEPADIIDYATDTLQATHIAWMASESYSSGLNWSTGVAPTLVSAGYPIVSTRPSQVP